MFLNKGGQKHLVSNIKGQWGIKQDGYRAESEESCVK